MDIIEKIDSTLEEEKIDQTLNEKEKNEKAIKLAADFGKVVSDLSKLITQGEKLGFKVEMKKGKEAVSILNKEIVNHIGSAYKWTY